MTTTNSIFKISIKAARINADMTRAELSQALGVCAGTLKNWENKKLKTQPTAEQFVKIAEITHTPLEFLCCNKVLPK